MELIVNDIFETYNLIKDKLIKQENEINNLVSLSESKGIITKDEINDYLESLAVIDKMSEY